MKKQYTRFAIKYLCLMFLYPLGLVLALLLVTTIAGAFFV